MPFDKALKFTKNFHKYLFKWTRKLLWGVLRANHAHVTVEENECLFHVPKAREAEPGCRPVSSDLEFCPLFCWTVNLQESGRGGEVGPPSCILTPTLSELQLSLGSGKSTGLLCLSGN